MCAARTCGHDDADRLIDNRSGGQSRVEMLDELSLTEPLQHAAQQQRCRIDELLGNPLHCLGEQVALMRVEDQDAHYLAARFERVGEHSMGPGCQRRRRESVPSLLVLGGQILDDYRNPCAQGFQAWAVVPLVLRFVDRRGYRAGEDDGSELPVSGNRDPRSWARRE